MAPLLDDSFSPFLIDAAGVRGALARLDVSYREVLSRHAYPPLLQRLLGELLAASVLLAGSLKFNGSLVLQLQGDGVLRLLVVECNRELGLHRMERSGAVVTSVETALFELLRAAGTPEFKEIQALVK